MLMEKHSWLAMQAAQELRPFEAYMASLNVEGAHGNLLAVAITPGNQCKQGSLIHVSR